jgi:hypothetical protein
MDEAESRAARAAGPIGLIGREQTSAPADDTSCDVTVGAEQRLAVTRKTRRSATSR